MLGVLLAMDFPGASELRVQVGSAVVSRGCDCGSPSVDLVVKGDVPIVASRGPRRATIKDRPSRTGVL